MGSGIRSKRSACKGPAAGVLRASWRSSREGLFGATGEGERRQGQGASASGGALSTVWRCQAACKERPSVTQKAPRAGVSPETRPAHMPALSPGPAASRLQARVALQAGTQGHRKSPGGPGRVALMLLRGQPDTGPPSYPGHLPLREPVPTTGRFGASVSPESHAGAISSLPLPLRPPVPATIWDTMSPPRPVDSRKRHVWAHCDHTGGGGAAIRACLGGGSCDSPHSLSRSLPGVAVPARTCLRVLGGRGAHWQVGGWP